MKKQLHIKKNLLTISLFVIGVLQANAQCAATTNVYAFTFNSKKYELIKEKKTWTEAAQCAVQRGAYLVHIDSLGEQTAVYNAIAAAGVPVNYNPVSDAGNVSYIWIGATDKNVEGTWLWDGDNNGIGINFWNGEGTNGNNNGNAVDGRYINWGGKSSGTIKEPDDFNANQDAAGIALSVTPSGSTIAGEWNDIAITNTLYFVVEYESTTGIKEAMDKHAINIFPNPGNERITIVTSNNALTTYLKLFSVTGNLIVEKTFNGNQIDIDIADLARGVYFIELNQEGILSKTKFIKN